MMTEFAASDPIFNQNFSSENLLVVAVSTVVWLILHVASHYASKALCPKVYDGLGPGKQPFWNIRVVSTIHATLVGLWSLQLLFFDWSGTGMSPDRLHGATASSNLLTGLAAGYFMYDLLGCLYYWSEFGVSFTLHGFLCFSVYFLGLRPFLQGFAPVFLLFELSTPFLNVNWFLDKFGQTGSRFQFVNGLCLVITFIGSRIFYGYYMSYVFWVLFLAKIHEIPPFLLYFFGISNLLLNGLNTLWFYQMIGALRRRFAAGKKKDVMKKTQKLR